MTEKIGLQAVLDDQDFQAGMQRYLAGVNALSNATDDMQAGAKQMTQGLGGVDNALEDNTKSFTEQLSAIQLVEKAYDQAKQVFQGGMGLAQLGADFDRQEQRFAAFAEAAGGATANIEAFQRGAGGTVNKMEAMTSASRLLQMGIVGSADEMEKVVEIATRLGDQTASAGDRVGDFALMLANTSIPRLDAYGLSAGFVRARIIELQEANADMTREQAFAQAVYEASETSLGLLGDRVEDNAAKMERAKAKIEDTKIELGQKFAGAAGVAAGAVADLEGSTLTLIAALTGAFGIATKFSGGLGPLIDKLGTSGTNMGALGLATIGLVVALERAQDQLNKMNAAQDAAQHGASQIADGMKELTSDSEAWGVEIDAIADKLERAKKKYDDNIVTGGILGDMMGTDAEFAAVMGNALFALDQELQRGTSNYTDYVAEVERANIALRDTGQTIEAVDQKSFEMSKRIEQSRVDWENLTAAERAHQEQIMAQINAVDGLTWSEVQEKVALDAATEAVNASAEAHKKWLGDAADATEKFNQEQGRRVAGQQTANEATKEDIFALQQATQVREDIAEAAEEYNKKLEEETKLQEEAAQAAQDHTVALLDQAEAMSDIDAAGAAGAAIEGLNQLLDEGALSLEQYEALVRGVQDDYGLVNDEGRALAEGMDELNAGLASGALSMEEYRAQLDALISTQVGSLEATKAQAEAQKELDKEIERAAKDAEKKAEQEFAKAEREAEQAREKAEREAEKLAEKIRQDVEREMEAAAKAAEELPGKLFDALSGLGSTAMKTLKDEMEPLDEELETIDDALEQWRAALDDPTADLADQENALQRIGELEAERAVIAEQRAEQEAKIAAFQEAQQQMALLQQQLDLMELVQENGLDAQEILGGLTADASASDIVAATTAAMQQIIEQTRAGLDFGGGASPTSAMTQAPAFSPPAMGGSTVNSTQNSFDLGGNNINTGMDAAQFEAMIRRVLAEAL